MGNPGVLLELEGVEGDAGASPVIRRPAQEAQARELDRWVVASDDATLVEALGLRFEIEVAALEQTDVELGVARERARVMPAAPAPTMQTSDSKILPSSTDRASMNIGTLRATSAGLSPHER
jgi:hypothetical protein